MDCLGGGIINLQETLNIKLEIGARKYGFMMPHYLEGKPQKLFALFVPRLVTRALTVSPNNPCVLCGLIQLADGRMAL